MRRALCTALFLAGTVQAAAAADVTLSLDEVHTLTFKRPVATVYVGNPAIADITMIDARHAFVLGKGFGRTNIVALNHDGVQVFNTQVNVLGGGSADTVTLNRGAQRVTYDCAGGRCEPAPMPGDGKDSYDLMNGQITTHQDNARKAASGG
jgi:hypothetical protein